VTDALNDEIKPAFDVKQKLRCHLKMNGQILTWNKSLEAAGIVNGSDLVLFINGNYQAMTSE
jgi:hypothetical protein